MHNESLTDNGMYRMIGDYVPLDAYVLNASYFAMLADDGGYCRRIAREGILLRKV